MSVTFDESRVVVVDHPLVQHKLSILRNKSTETNKFRSLVRELSMFEAYEATHDLELEDVEVETPLETCTCKRIVGKKVAIVPILRAGLGMVDGIIDLVPSARIGHVGMYRDPETHEPHSYYCKLPAGIAIAGRPRWRATGGGRPLGTLPASEPTPGSQAGPRRVRTSPGQPASPPYLGLQ